MSAPAQAPGRRESSWRVLRWMAAAGCLASTACGGSTDPGRMGVPVAGAWTYAGVQVAPAAAQLTGTLSFTSQTGAAVSGTFDVTEVGAAGQQRRLAGPISGHTVDSTTLDFDVLLGDVTRRHVGQV